MAKRSKTTNSIVWVVVIALVVGFGAGYLMARAKYTAKIGVISVLLSKKDDEVKALKAKMNKVMMQNGRMMIMTDGEVSRLNEDLTLSDGTKMMRNGEYQKPNQPMMRMQNGEAMDMDGNMMDISAQ
ncbi:MAG: hypothetical protein HYT10_00165 [Candidatus Levybacteria bacterium]|nr:hypothetical protein [Candidatus Levybacteria bacterium]